MARRATPYGLGVADIGLLALGAAIGFVVNEALGRSLRGAERRRTLRRPLLVHVETDPAVIWAGMPPWISAGFLMPPEAEMTAPPGHCPEWRSWAHAQGGVDQRVTQVRVTVTARQNLVVVVDALQVKVHSRTPVPPWRSIICGVGGADITPRRAEIRLSDTQIPLVQWLDDDGSVIHLPTFSVSSSEAEVLHLWAYVGDEWVEWSAQLLMLVDGRRHRVEISDGGMPFVTSGSAGSISQHMWSSEGDRWSPPLPN